MTVVGSGVLSSLGTTGTTQITDKVDSPHGGLFKALHNMTKGNMAIRFGATDSAGVYGFSHTYSFSNGIPSVTVQGGKVFHQGKLVAVADSSALTLTKPSSGAYYHWISVSSDGSIQKTLGNQDGVVPDLQQANVPISLIKVQSTDSSGELATQFFTTTKYDNSLSIGHQSSGDYAETANILGAATGTTITNSVGDIIIDNVDTNDQIVMRLGTDTSATGFEIRNNSDAVKFAVDGAGTVTFPALTGVTVAVDDKVIIRDTSSSDALTTVTTQAIANLYVAPITSTANGVNNRIATYSATTALNGEANLTFDATTLIVTGNQTITPANDVAAAALTITNADTDQIALDINADNIDADVIDITADSVTTANVIDITADGLTTGRILKLHSNSSTTNDRQLVNIRNDNTAATGTVPLHIVNDSTNDCLILESTNSDAQTEPSLKLFRNSGSPAANDYLGEIRFTGEDAANAQNDYARLGSRIITTTNGAEAGAIILEAQHRGTMRTILYGEGHTTGTGQIVMNHTGQDINFLVNTANDLSTVVVDASTDRVGIGTATPSTKFEIKNHSTEGHSAFKIDNDDTDQIAMAIDAANINADVVDITANALTTSKVMNISATGLTDGMLLNAATTSTVTDGGTSTLVSTAMTNDGLGSQTAKGILLDYNKTGITASGKTANVSALHIDMDDSVTNVGTVTMTGLDVDLTFGNTGGTVTNIGLDVAVAGGDENYALKLTGGSILIGQLEAAPTDVTNHGQLWVDNGGSGAANTELYFTNDNGDDIQITDGTGLAGGGGGSVSSVANGTNDRIATFSSSDALNGEANLTFSGTALAVGGNAVITQGSTGGQIAFKIDNDDVDKVAMDIDAANTTADVIDIGADTLTTANVIDVTANALTTGSILNLISNSVTTNTRNLVYIKNDHASASGTTPLYVENDANGRTATFKSTGTSNGATVQLITTDDDANGGPILELFRDSASPAPSDVLGLVEWWGRDDGGTKTQYGYIAAAIQDEDNGDESTQMDFSLLSDTTGTSAIGAKLRLAGSANGGFDRAEFFGTIQMGIGASSIPVNRLHIGHTGVDGDNGMMIVREDASTADGDLLGGIGFDSADGNVPSSVLEASAFIASIATEDHTGTDKGGNLKFGVSLIDENEDVVSTVLASVGPPDTIANATCHAGFNSRATTAIVAAATYAPTIGDSGALVIFEHANSNLTLPSINNTTSVGVQFTVFNETGSAINAQIAVSNSATVNGGAIAALDDIASFKAATFVCSGNNTWIRIG